MNKIKERCGECGKPEVNREQVEAVAAWQQLLGRSPMPRSYGDFLKTLSAVELLDSRHKVKYELLKQENSTLKSENEKALEIIEMIETMHSKINEADK